MADGTAQARQDVEELIGSAVDFAKKMLSESGAFSPFGRTMDLSGEIGFFSALLEDDDSTSKERIALLKGAFQDSAAKGEIKAAAIVYDVVVKPPGAKAQSDAIAVALDHTEDYSVIVLYPYSLDKGYLDVGEPFAIASESDIFV